MPAEPMLPTHPDPASSGRPPHVIDAASLPELIAEDSLLSSLLEGIARASGTDCFQVMTRSLAGALGVRYAVVAEFIPETDSARSLAFWDGTGFAPTIEWPLAGTPCRAVIDGQFCHFPRGVQLAFPDDKDLASLHVESYLGVPLLDPRGSVLGHLFVMDTRAMPPAPRNLAVFRIFAARAAAELTRLRLEHSLRQTEERFRDLFDEAPIAYVHEGLDTRFIRANRTAMRILGIRPDEVEGTYGRTFVPDTPDAQRRLRDALDSISRGTDTSGVVLELRRKDNGKPVWIQWWSRPDPGGAYTRTMFLDITDRVLLEQEQARLQAQNRYLREELRSSQHFGDIVGSSPPLREVLAAVDRVAPTDTTVLIQGETGTGKELVARAIHEHSHRRAAPFVKVNCAALPAGLVESEFFGHEKGAFTGAVAARRGRFELADGGTIFLDEVGEISHDVQVKLLRVLQESQFERVGGTHTVRVNVRVIAATNRDLAADASAARFRPDLFYRLSVFPIHVPPLRRRASDIPVLAAYFVTQLSSSLGKRIDRIDPDSLDRLVRYHWPGNIRELRNVLERAVILSDSSILTVAPHDLSQPASPVPALAPHQPASAPAASTPSATPHSPAPTPSAPATPPAAPATLADVERAHILAVLRRTNGAVAGPRGAARILGIPPSTLRSRMARLGITL